MTMRYARLPGQSQIIIPKGTDIITPPTADWEPMLIGQWMDSVTETQQYLIEDLMPADSNILVSGIPKKSFKSWLTEIICIVISSGVTIPPFVPVNKEGLPVLYLYAEGARIGTKTRQLMLETGLKVNIHDNKKFFFTHRENLMLKKPENVRKIVKAIQRHEIKLLVIDPFVMFAGINENDVKEMAEAIHVLNEFRAVGATVLFNHHITKEMMSTKTGKAIERDVDQDVRGSSALIGFYDQHWAIRRRNPDYNDLVIRSKEDEEREYEMYFTFIRNKSAGFELVLKDKDDVRAELKEDIFRSMSCKPDITYSANMIKAIGEGLSWDMTEELIQELVEEGKLESIDRGFRVKGNLLPFKKPEDKK